MFNIKSKLKQKKINKEWRVLNKHNDIQIENICEISKIKAGKFSYGNITVNQWGEKSGNLEIGNFVSIASGVKFLLGGNHFYKGISTFPFRVKVTNEKIEDYTNGNIIVESHAWIGMDSMILSGVRIGEGAIIGARSLIVNDVPDYAIVGGNPAKLIKYRFSKEVIDILKEYNLEDLDIEAIKENLECVYEEININNINKILKKLKIERKK